LCRGACCETPGGPDRGGARKTNGRCNPAIFHFERVHFRGILTGLSTYDAGERWPDTAQPPKAQFAQNRSGIRYRVVLYRFVASGGETALWRDPAAVLP